MNINRVETFAIGLLLGLFIAAVALHISEVNHMQDLVKYGVAHYNQTTGQFELNK